MIITYPLNGIDYGAEDAQLYTCTRTSGVYASDTEFPVESVSGRTVTIGEGRAWISPAKFMGMATAIKSQESIAIPSADGLLPRKDLIVYRWDKAKNKCYLYVISGTASSNPERPAISRTEEIYDLGLYEVLCPASSVEVERGNITSVMMDETVCGIMRDGVTGLPTDEIQQQAVAKIESIDAQLNEFLAAKTEEVSQSVSEGQQQIDTFIEENTQEFNAWFEDVQGQLGGDVAGNLLNEINGVKARVTVLEDYPTNATALYSDGVVAITSEPETANTIYFYAPSDYSETDTYTLNGNPMTIKDLNGETVYDAWKTGSPVMLMIKGNVGFFKSGGGGSATDTLPPMVENLKAQGSDAKINLSWNNPDSDAFSGVMAVYNSVAVPVRPSDGTRVDAGTAESLELTELENEVTYYIRMYPYNAKRQYQTLIEGATASAMPSQGPQQVSGFEVSGSGTAPVLVWINPVDVMYYETVIIQKEGSAPTGITDGTEIYRGTGTTVTASCPESGVTYYWGAFTVSAEGGYRPAITLSYKIELPGRVTSLAVEGTGASPVITWVNPSDVWYRTTVVVQKVGSEPSSIIDGTEIYRGTGETVTASGLENYTDYYFAVYTLNEAGGYGIPVVSEAYSYEFPAEPTEYTEVTRITSTQEYTFPEMGWFKIVAVAGGGDGGYGFDVDGGRIYSPGSGGSGGISVGKISTSDIDKINVSISGKNISIGETGMSATSGGNAENISNTSENRDSPGRGGAAGGASGGNVENIQGTPGKSGNSAANNRTASGGKPVSTTYGNYLSTSGKGSDAIYSNYNGSATANGTGTNAYVVILRGNTNTPAATD